MIRSSKAKVLLRTKSKVDRPGPEETASSGVSSGALVLTSLALLCGVASSCSSPGASTSHRTSGTSTSTSQRSATSSTSTTVEPTSGSTTTTAASTTPGIEVQVYPTGVLLTIESHVSDLSSRISNPHFASPTEFDLALRRDPAVWRWGHHDLGDRCSEQRRALPGLVGDIGQGSAAHPRDAGPSLGGGRRRRPGDLLMTGGGRLMTRRPMTGEPHL